jgi:hypothetical protein
MTNACTRLAFSSCCRLRHAWRQSSAENYCVKNFSRSRFLHVVNTGECSASNDRYKTRSAHLEIAIDNSVQVHALTFVINFCEEKRLFCTRGAS